MLLPMQGTRRRLLGMLSLGLFFTGLGLGKIGSPFSYPLQAWGFALALYFLATRLLRNSKSRPTVRGLLKLSFALSSRLNKRSRLSGESSAFRKFQTSLLPIVKKTLQTDIS